MPSERASTEQQINPAGRLAGIDYGAARIGIAITDADQTLASPLENYTRRGPDADKRFFQQLAQDEQIARFIVGLPVHLDGRESEQSTAARQFGQWLGEITGVPVVFFDERFTTSEAERLLASASFTKKQRKARLDKLAAQIMLSAYLESEHREPGDIRGLD
jgi:putative Holliday junction resolvase